MTRRAGRGSSLELSRRRRRLSGRPPLSRRRRRFSGRPPLRLVDSAQRRLKLRLASRSGQCSRIGARSLGPRLSSGHQRRLTLATVRGVLLVLGWTRVLYTRVEH